MRSSASVNRYKLQICEVFDGITHTKPQAPHPSQIHLPTPPSVIPANAGTHGYGGPSDIAPSSPGPRPWDLTSAGMTGGGNATTGRNLEWRARNVRQARATPPQTIPPASLFSREGGSPVWVPAFAGKHSWHATASALCIAYHLQRPAPHRATPNPKPANFCPAPPTGTNP